MRSSTCCGKDVSRRYAWAERDRICAMSSSNENGSGFPSLRPEEAGAARSGSPSTDIAKEEAAAARTERRSIINSATGVALHFLSPPKPARTVPAAEITRCAASQAPQTDGTISQYKIGVGGNLAPMCTPTVP